MSSPIPSFATNQLLANSGKRNQHHVGLPDYHCSLFIGIAISCSTWMSASAYYLCCPRGKTGIERHHVCPSKSPKHISHHGNFRNDRLFRVLYLFYGADVRAKSRLNLPSTIKVPKEIKVPTPCLNITWRLLRLLYFLGLTIVRIVRLLWNKCKHPWRKTISLLQRSYYPSRQSCYLSYIFNVEQMQTTEV